MCATAPLTKRTSIPHGEVPERDSDRASNHAVRPACAYSRSGSPIGSMQASVSFFTLLTARLTA